MPAVCENDRLGAVNTRSCHAFYRLTPFLRAFPERNDFHNFFLDMLKRLNHKKDRPYRLAGFFWRIFRKEMKPEIAKFERHTEKGKKRIAIICQAAAKVFYEKGFLSSTLADIASAAGTTKGSIFHFFSTKDELLFLILYHYHESTLAQLKQDLISYNSPHERIYCYIKSFIAGYRDRQIESRLALNERFSLPQRYLEIIREKEREFVNILRSLVEDVLKKKPQNRKQTTLLVYSLLGMCTWPYRWFDPRGELSPEELARTIYEIFTGDLKNHLKQSNRKIGHIRLPQYRTVVKRLS
jgi:AcrR family transcriptional regulator